MSHLGSDFWNDFDGRRTDRDSALIQTMRTVRAIRGADRPRAEVPEEIRAALAHLCAAMDGLVDWMEQERRADPDAVKLLGNLQEIGSGIVRCLSACPLDIILKKPAAPSSNAEQLPPQPVHELESSEESEAVTVATTSSK